MIESTSIDPSAISTSEIQKLLLATVAPRPIAFASTVDSEGNVNLSPFSFFNVFSSNPPILIFSPARRSRDNSIKHTLENVTATKQVVINIVNYSIIEQMSLTSTEYDRGINEFEKAGLTALPSEKIVPPRVKESPVSFECVVDDIIALGSKGGAGNLVISRVVHIHIDNKYISDKGEIDIQKLDLVARMGGNWYARIVKESLFEIAKPVLTKGIGVDNLPKHIFNTNVLSGNNIGQLGNVEKIPSKIDLIDLKTDPEVLKIIQIEDHNSQLESLHKLVKLHLENNNIDLAIKTIFVLEK